MFNALKYIKKLEAVGFAREQAEAQVQLVLDSIETEVATKSDIAEVRSDIASFKSEVRADIADFKSEMRADFAELKAEFAEFKMENINIVLKLGAAIVGAITVATTVLGILIKF